MRNVGLLLFCLICASWTSAAPVAQPPARVVTAYALTSAQDFWAEEYPGAWTLLASNDGQSWDVLDTQTDQTTVDAPCTRRVFHIPNQKAYRIYRLRVDAKPKGTPQQVSLAEIELLGPVVGVAKEADLQANITSSQEYPLVGAAINAFDGDVATKWTDFGLYHPGGCWIQCEYVRQSELLMTNLYQVRLAAKLVATRTLLLEKAPQILSNLAASAAQKLRTLTGYALTSANDHLERDPRDWQLLGSNDGGKSWNVVDVRRNQIFPGRLQRRVFELNKPADYALYRLQIAVRTPGDDIQLAEVEPLYADKPGRRDYSLVVAASSEHPPMEKTEMAFDDDPRSKWLAFTGDSDQFAWIQWQCVPQVDGLPLINRHQLDQLGQDNRTR
ncbi:MAG TPA: hypothetical protein VL970_07015, partial [Candidatus Acidoferrales bacterium]|nr:hypothetical protein [Candidatus Acidoferrales bacterium]